MYWLDWVIIGIAVIGIIYGLAKGLIMQVLRLIVALLSLFIAFRACVPGSKVFSTAIHNSSTATGISFIIIFIVVGIVLWILATLLGRGLAKVFCFMGFGWLDRVLGGLFGIIMVILVVGMISSSVLMFFPRAETYISKSVLAPKAIYATSRSAAVFPADLRENFFDKLEQLKRLLKQKKESKLQI